MQDYNQNLCIGELSAVHFWEDQKPQNSIVRISNYEELRNRFHPAQDLALLCCHVINFSRQQWSTCCIYTGIQTRVFGEAILQKDYKAGPSNLHLQK